MTKGSTHHRGGRCPILLFLIKSTLVSVGPELDAGDPRRGPPHLLTDYVKRDIRAALDDQLVVNVTADKAVRERPHGVGEDVSGDSLHDVLDELGTVTLDPGPVLCGIDPHVRHTLTAETVLANPGLHISQLPAGRERDEQHPVSHLEGDVTDLCPCSLCDRIFDCAVDCPPVSCNVRITAAPHIYKWLKFFFRDSHVSSAHRFQSANAAAVAKRELCDLAALPEMAVLAVLLDRNAEHPAGALTVDIPAFMKDFGTPLFMREVAEHTGFDGAEVADDEFVSRSRDKRGPDEFG